MRAWAVVVCVGCAPVAEKTGEAGVTDSGAPLEAPAASPVDAAAFSVCINELMASNEVALVLDDGTTPDWLEVHNPSARDVSLDGWTVLNESDGGTADLSGIGTLPAGAFLVLYADGSSQGGVHLPFTLQREGGAVFLQRDDGGGDRIVYGETQTDMAISRTTDCCASDDDGCFEGRFGGTPGWSNVE